MIIECREWIHFRGLKRFSGTNDNALINVNDMRDVVAAAFPTTENVHPNLDLGRYLTDKSRTAFSRDEASAMILAK